MIANLVKVSLKTTQLNIGVESIDHLVLVHFLHNLLLLRYTLFHLLQVGSQFLPNKTGKECL